VAEVGRDAGNDDSTKRKAARRRAAWAHCSPDEAAWVGEEAVRRRKLGTVKAGKREALESLESLDSM